MPRETSAAIGELFRGFSGYVQADANEPASPISSEEFSFPVFGPSLSAAETLRHFSVRWSAT
jgi:hypothetical protein